MSYRSLNTKPLNASLAALLKRTGHIGLGLSAFTPVLALANPTGGTVIAGTATITNPNANGTVVKETSAAAIIDWQQFNIGKGQYVQFLQPSSSSIILNRVIGGGGSSIYGSLTGNGQIFLVNTNGVFFGKGSSIDAQGFLASTLDISDSDFLARNFVFDKSGSDATVINQGSITAHKGGYVVLAGDYTENDGIIAAQSGHIILASGTKSTLTLNGNSLVSYAINQATLAQLAGVTNAGKLEADGGTVIMTADVANLLKATVVNNTGLIEATSLSNQGGVIQLLATGGNISNAGTLDVAATRAGQQGGSITLKGDEKTLLTDTSKIIATGDGADGGKVEVSGDTVALRGDMDIGKGGRLLLDPDFVQLITGSSFSAGANGLHGGTASSAEGQTSRIGTAFIQTQLEAGALVAISAHTRIDASANVKTITATTGANAAKGVLEFKTASGGTIELGGVDITIAGKLSADFGHGSFGYLQAGSIALTASGDIELERAASNAGKITTYTAKTTVGNLTIDAGDITTFGSAEFGLALDAVKGAVGMTAGVNLSSNERLVAGQSITLFDGVTLTGSFQATAAGQVSLGNVQASAITVDATNKSAGHDLFVGNLQATGGDIVLTNAGSNIVVQGTGNLQAEGDIDLTAKHIEHTGSDALSLQASGDITLKGIIGATSAAGLGERLVMDGKVIKVDHAVHATSVEIQGQSLAYTGAGNTFAITGSKGIDLDAAIGSAAAPVKYGVKLTAKSGTIQIEDNIYTGNTTGKAKAAASITIAETDTAAGASLRGVIVGGANRNPVTLSAKGNISITGDAVGIGFSALGLHLSHSAAVSIKAGKNLSITAAGHGSGTFAGEVVMRGGLVNASDATSDRSISLQAGGNLSVTAAKDISVHGGEALLDVSTGTATVTGDAAVTLKASGNLTMAAGSSLNISGGVAKAEVTGSPATTRGADAVSGVSVIAGRAMTLTGHDINLDGGSASAGGGVTNLGKFVATATTDLTVTAGTTLSATAVDNLGIGGGDFAGHHAEAFSSLTSVTFTAIAHADTDIHAGTLKLKGKSIDIGAGSHVLGSEGLHSSMTAAKGAETDVTYTANVDITVGAGGASIDASGGSLVIDGGTGAGRVAKLQATGAGAKLSVTAQANVDITATGAVSLTGKGVMIGGGSGGTGARVKASSGGAADLGIDTGVDLQGTSLKLTATGGPLTIKAGGALFEALVSADTLATATVADSAGIALAATKGNLTVKGAGAVLIEGGFNVAGGINGGESTSTRQISGSHYLKTTRHFDHHAGAKASGFGATATLDGSAGVKLSATGNVALSQSHSHGLSIQGGAFTGAEGSASAADGGNAKFMAATAVTVKAGGNVTMTALTLKVQSGHGQLGGSVESIHSTAICTAPGDCASSAFQSVETAKKGATAVGAHAKALSSIDAGVSVQGANLTLSAATLKLSGGSEDVLGVGISAKQGGSALGVYRNDLSFAATKVLTMKATTSFQAVGGAEAGEDAEISATGLGATASMQLDEQLSITAGSVSLTDSHAIRFNDGGSSGGETSLGQAFLKAGTGAAAQLQADLGIQVKATGAFTAKASDIDWSFSHAAAKQLMGIASGGKVSADIQDSIGISARTLQLTAGNINLSGMDRAASVALLKASAGGSLELKMHTGMDLTAATALSAIATGHLSIAAGAGAFSEASLQAQIGKASADVDSGIAIDVIQKSGTLTLQAGTLDLGLAGIHGGSAARSAKVVAQSDGSADLTATGNVELSALGAVKLTGTTGLALQGPSFTASGLHLLAHGPDTKVSADVEASLDVTGASVTLTSGRTLAVTAGKELASHLFTSLTSGASVTATLEGHVDLKATSGALTLTGGAPTGTADVIKIATGLGVGEDAGMAVDGGKLSQARYSLDASVTLDGATGISLAADRIQVDSTHTGALGVLADDSIHADQGRASIDARVGVDILTSGTFTAKATEVLELSGYDARVGAGGGGSHFVGARSGGIAALTVDGALDITAQNVTITGADGVTIIGGEQAGLDAVMKVANSGSATLQIDDGVSIQASKAISITAGPSHSVLIRGGVSDGKDASLTGLGGKASLGVAANVDLQAATMTLTAGSFVTLAGGGALAAGAQVQGSHSGGSETLTAHAGVTVNVTGAFNVKAGANILLTANSSGVVAALGKGAKVATDGSDIGNHASMVLGDAVDVNVGTATLKASGQVALVGNFGAASGASLEGHQFDGVTSLTADGRVDLDAKGAITITASLVNFSGGGSGGDMHMGVSHANDHVSASLDDGVGINAGGALSIKAGTIDIKGGGRLGAGMSVMAGSSGSLAPPSAQASAAAHIAADVKIQAAGITMTAASTLTIAGESSAGDSVHVTALHGAKGQVTVSGTAALNATGAMNLAASVFSLHGGSGATFQGPSIQAKGHGLASYQQQAGVSLTAATIALTGAGSFTIAGGKHLKGSVNADGGSAVMGLHDGVTIAATGTLSMTAGSNLVVQGGSDLRVLEQVGSHAGGTSAVGAIPAGAGAGDVSATADVSVGIQAGTDITIKAAKAVDLQAGTKVLLALGAYAQANSSAHTSFFGHTWAGGLAALDADTGINVQAGRDLTVTAGSGNLDLAGLRGSAGHSANRVTTRGGSNDAVADVKLAADAVLSAGSDLTLNVKGTAIVAGGTASDVSDQGKGDLDTTVSDGAQVHAGHDVVLNSVTGGMVVTGAHTLNVQGVDSLGAHIAVVVNGDASISAGHAIRTVKTLGGDVTVQGGTLHLAGLDGSASGAISVAAQAGLHAGASISLVQTGNFTVEGGFGTMSIGAHTHGLGRGVLDLDAAVTAPGTLSITANHIQLLGGDVKMSALDLGGDVRLSAVGSANVDVSVGTLAMTAAGSLGFFGGGDGGGAFTEFAHTGSQASLSASAENDVDVQVLHNATIKTTAGNASFMGGLADKAGGSITGDHDTALSATEDDVTLNVGGNLSLTIDGNLKVQGGEGVEQDGSTKVTGSGDDVQAQVDSRVDITAAGNLTLATSTKSNFQITVQGGDSAGGGFHVFTGPGGAALPDTLDLDVDTSVALTAGGTLSITSALPVKLDAGKFGTLGSSASSNGLPKVALVSDVVLTGKAISFSKNLNPIIASSGTRVAGGLVQQSIVTITVATPVAAFTPLSLPAGLGTLQAQGIVVNLETLLAMPAPRLGGGVSFMPAAAPSGAFPQSCSASLLTGTGRDCAPAGR